MITIDRISTPSHTLMIEGNGGEELLVMLYCGEVVITTVSAGAASPEVFYSGEISKDRLKKLLIQWSHNGIKPTQDESTQITKRIDQAIRIYDRKLGGVLS